MVLLKRMSSASDNVRMLFSASPVSSIWLTLRDGKHDFSESAVTIGLSA